MNISTQPGAPRYSGSHLQQKKTRGAKRKKKKKPRGNSRKTKQPRGERGNGLYRGARNERME